MPLFDDYVIVDWSAATKRKTGKDSIWIGHANQTGLSDAFNPATRHEAMEYVRKLFRRTIAENRRMMVGFDFGFGYPKGAAKRISGSANWKAVWDFMAKCFPNGDQSEAKERFRIADMINRECFGKVGPFWRHSGKASFENLPYHKPDFEKIGVSERRFTEQSIPRAKSNWELLNPGSVGSQTMLGMAWLSWLLKDAEIAGNVDIWPFQTGFGVPENRIVMLEVYPSTFSNSTKWGTELVEDEKQVRTLSAGFAALDRKRKLRSLFQRPEHLSSEELESICSEEGWIFGIGSKSHLLKDAIEDGASEAEVPVTGGQLEYIRDPAEIYRQSFSIVESETMLEGLPKEMRRIAVRLVHSCGMTDVVDDLEFSANAAAEGISALEAGKPVFVDVEMVKSGIIKRFLPANNELICTLNHSDCEEHAKEISNTRSAAAVDFWDERLEGAIVVIGNAPTALFRLLERVRDGGPKPSLVIGIPVGFVGAVESKRALAENRFGLEFITVHGRRGGSAMASSVLNALTGNS